MIDSAVLDAMVASGCTAEQIATAVKASCAAHEAEIEAKRKCYVYRLVDPRCDNRTFYVGVASDPDRRFRNHVNDPASAAFHILKAIKAGGFDLDPIMQIEAECPDRTEALMLEAELIALMPGLVNRAVVAK